MAARPRPGRSPTAARPSTTAARPRPAAATPRPAPPRTSAVTRAPAPPATSAPSSSEPARVPLASSGRNALRPARLALRPQPRLLRQPLGAGLSAGQDLALVDRGDPAVLQDHPAGRHRRHHVVLAAGVDQRRDRVMERRTLRAARVEQEEV